MQPALAGLLRGTRLSLHLTIEELSRASGVSERAISDIERGVSRAPQRRTVDALADGLRLSEGDRARLLDAASSARRQGVPTRVTGIAPAPVSDFTGRATEIEAIVAALQLPRRVGRCTTVVVGPPGFGKTSVALEAVARVEGLDVECFVALGGSTDAPREAIEVLSALVRQVRGSEAEMPHDLEDAARQWKASLEGRRVAVVLDDAADEAQVRPILGVLAGDGVVITSRRTLGGLDDVTRVTLDAFAESESESLLRMLVPRAQIGPEGLIELAWLCGHVPLALRIAGNRLASRPSWVVADLVHRLRDDRGRIRNLRVGDRAVEPIFALSYDQLDSSSQRLFRRLSIVDGQTFTAELVASFAGCDALTAETTLETLADLGLVQAMTAGRYRLHDLLKVYAADRLLGEEGSETTRELRSALHSWLLARTADAGGFFEEDAVVPEADFPFRDRAGASAWLRAESAHWLAAFEAAAGNGWHRTVIGTAESLHWFSDLWPEWGRWHDVFTLSVSAARAIGDPAVMARHLGYLAWAQIVEQRNIAAASVTADLAVMEARRSGDPLEQAWAEFYVQWAARRRGDARAAIAAADRIALLLASSDHHEIVLNALRARAIQLAELGEHRAALDGHAAVLARAEKAVARSQGTASAAIVVALSRGSIARELLELGDPEAAVDWATFAIELFARLDSQSGQGWATAARAMALERMGYRADARRDADETLVLLQGGADPEGAEEAEGVIRRVTSGLDSP